ncbi:MAG: CHRD domain-containing protein [Chitinophagaceae bacterium]
MKTNFMFGLKSRISLILLGVLLSVTFFSCSKSSSTTVHFQGTMSGSNETPSNGSPATGTVNAYYNTQTKIMTYTLNWSNLTSTPVAMHFHEGPIGVAGGVIIGITGFPATISGTVSGTSSALTISEDSALLTGDVYANIHTTNYPGGEIRAQLIKQ